MRINIEAKGIEQIAAKVKELEDNLKKKVIGSAARKASRPLIVAAKANVPVGDGIVYRYKGGKKVSASLKRREFRYSGGTKIPYVPGNLKESIMFFQSKKSTILRPLFYVGPRAGGGRKNDGWYAHFLEYGTVNHAASPFMRPAYEATKKTVQGIIGDEILNAVERFK